MSYEGYVEQLCQIGHYKVNDAYETDYHCHCGEEIVWNNHVDVTNGASFPYIGFLKIKEELEEVEDCPTCKRAIQDIITYNIPTEDEMKSYEEAKHKFYRTTG